MTLCDTCQKFFSSASLKLAIEQNKLWRISNNNRGSTATYLRELWPPLFLDEKGALLSLLFHINWKCHVRVRSGWEANVFWESIFDRWTEESESSFQRYCCRIYLIKDQVRDVQLYLPYTAWRQREWFVADHVRKMTEQVKSTLHVERFDPKEQRRSSCSLLTRYLLEEYAKRENEAAAFKSRYENAYIRAYGSHQPLRDVLPRDSTVDIIRPGRRESCPAFVSFFGWMCVVNIQWDFTLLFNQFPSPVTFCKTCESSRLFQKTLRFLSKRQVVYIVGRFPLKTIRSILAQQTVLLFPLCLLSLIFPLFCCRNISMKWQSSIYEEQNDILWSVKN